jgi:peptidylprolyl isomerase
MKKAQNGDKLKVHYTGKLEDGSVFDSSVGREPLEFVLGNGSLIAGFERAVSGLQPGEKTTATLAPEEAYGEPSMELLFEVPKANIPEEIKPEIGMQLSVSQPDGQQMPVVIAEVKEESITLDANHPLAGKTLIFEIEVMEVAGS